MEKLRIAICGGGIASLCLAHALTVRNSRLEVKIYEGSDKFREQSAAVGLGSNAQKALAMISPQLRKALDQAGGVPNDPSCRIMMGSGTHQGQHIGDITHVIPQIMVHRGALWWQIRALIPDNTLEMGKKLIEVNNSLADGPVTLCFEDGSKCEVDALVGCDGINSITRQAVLGPDHPAVAPIYTGEYGHVMALPIEAAIAAFGQEYCSVKTQTGWIGHNGVIITDFHNDGTSMQVIVGSLTAKEPWLHTSPFVEWPKETLKEQLRGWGTFGQKVLEIFTRQEKLFAAGSRVHRDTPSYCKDSVCIAGDAAQSFPPAQGAGAGQAIEDALILSTVLGMCSTKDDIPHAFRTYDALRRPRRREIANSSAYAVLILTGRAPGIGLNPDRLAEQFSDWASAILDYDLEAAKHEALERMKQKS